MDTHYPADTSQDPPSQELVTTHIPSRKRQRYEDISLYGGNEKSQGMPSAAPSKVGISGTTPPRVGVSPQRGDQLVPCEDEGVWLETEDEDMYSSVCKKSKYSEEAHHTTHSTGLFQQLPTEILHLILSHLSHRDISSLSLTSWGLNSALRDYVFTAAGSRRVLPDTPPLVTGSGHVLSGMPFTDEDSTGVAVDVEETAKEFETLGFLMKQLTMFQPIKSRLGVASFFLNKMKHTHQALVMFSGHSAAYYCFGRLLFAFIRGWEEQDKEEVFTLIQAVVKFEDRVSEVLNSPPSSHPLLERDVRLLHRRVFLDHASRLGNKDFVFWLTLILKPWPTHSQARLLYLLLAPENSQGFISWTEVCGCSNLQHEMDFGELAHSLRLLLELNPRDWSMDSIVTIVDQLTSTPNGWCLENVSQLLIVCGRDITKGVLGHRASLGRAKDLVALCFYLGNACASKDSQAEEKDQNIRWYLDILRNTLSMLPAHISKHKFIHNLVGTWQDYLETLFDDCSPEEAESDEVRTEFSCVQGNVAKLLSVLLVEVVIE